MALPDLTEAKAYLRLDTAVEDDLLTNALATATALVEQATRISILGETRTFKGRHPIAGYLGPMTRLAIPVWPVNTTATITDGDGDVVTDEYTVDARTSWVDLDDDTTAFTTPPYTIEVATGAVYHPTYATVVEPLLRQAILDLTADIYKRRVSSVEYEQSGGQVSVTYTSEEMALRTKAIVRALRQPGRAW